MASSDWGRIRPARDSEGMGTMLLLISGLVLFLGAHSIRIAAPDWRGRTIERLGEKPWKGFYALASLAGFVLIVLGVKAMRAEPLILWQPPAWLAMLTALLTIPAFILLAAAYVPGNRIKEKVGHPMLLAVKFWSFGHLLGNGKLYGVLLFGAFLVWSIVDYASCRRRDRANKVVQPAGNKRGDAITLIAGLAGWALFAFLLHGLLIGYAPLG